MVMGFRGISNSYPALLSDGLGNVARFRRIQMSSDLKKLVDELEFLLGSRGGSLDAPAKREFEAQLDQIRKSIESDDAKKLLQVRKDILQTMASLLSVLTNVMNLLS